MTAVKSESVSTYAQLGWAPGADERYEERAAEAREHPADHLHHQPKADHVLTDRRGSVAVVAHGSEGTTHLSVAEPAEHQVADHAACDHKDEEAPVAFRGAGRPDRVGDERDAGVPVEEPVRALHDRHEDYGDDKERHRLVVRPKTPCSDKAGEPSG